MTFDVWKNASNVIIKITTEHIKLFENLFVKNYY